MNFNWYKRKDGVTVLKVGRRKVLEIFKRPGGFWACFVFSQIKKDTLLAANGYFASALPKKYHAVRWGMKKARELKIIV